MEKDVRQENMVRYPSSSRRDAEEKETNKLFHLKKIRNTIQYNDLKSIKL